MLNNYFISRDAIGFLQHYLEVCGKAESAQKKLLNQITQRQYMSYELWWQTLEDLAVALDEPCLGLEVGKQVTVAQCGILGYLFRTSRDALEALHCFKRFERLIYAGSHVRTEMTEDTLTLMWDPDYGYSSQLSDELLLAAMVNVMREIMAPHHFHATNIQFTQALPANSVQRYADFFQCDVQQTQSCLRISFPLLQLEKSIPQGDAQLHLLLDQQAQAQLSRLPADDTFLEGLRETMLRALHEGRPEADFVARQLGMSARSLHRHLKQRGMLYRDTLRNLRQDMAQVYLRDDKLTLAEVALLLGYAEQSVFNRAFKYWFDVSPAQWRKQNYH